MQAQPLILVPILEKKGEQLKYRGTQKLTFSYHLFPLSYAISLYTGVDR